MKRFRLIHATAFFLALGIIGSVEARQDKPEKQDEKAKPSNREKQAEPERQQQEKSANTQEKQQGNRQERQQSQKRADSENQSRQDNAAKQQVQAERQQEQQQQPRDSGSPQRHSSAQVHQQQVAFQNNRAHSWQSEHRTWQQRGGYSGYRVPDDRFREYYGQDHAFRIYSLPVIFIGGGQRFQYGGYWFGLIDPWPEYWPSDWYDSDDVYVNYDGDGYYLYNRRYPSDRIAISFYRD